MDIRDSLVYTTRRHARQPHTNSGERQCVSASSVFGYSWLFLPDGEKAWVTQRGAEKMCESLGVTMKTHDPAQGYPIVAEFYI